MKKKELNFEPGIIEYIKIIFNLLKSNKYIYINIKI